MIEGWMGKGPRKWLRRQARQHYRIVEVGVWKGKTTQLLAANTPGIVWAVDHWAGTPHDAEQHALYPDAGEAAFNEFSRNLGPFIARRKVRVVRMPSTDAAHHLMRTEARRRPFDFVFIDADHGYDAVQTDIAAWLPLVRTGGLIAGHDYKPNYPGVIAAVDEAFGGAAEIGPASIWSMRVAGARSEVA